MGVSTEDSSLAVGLSKSDCVSSRLGSRFCEAEDGNGRAALALAMAKALARRGLRLGDIASAKPPRKSIDGTGLDKAWSTVRRPLSTVAVPESVLLSGTRKLAEAARVSPVSVNAARGADSAAAEEPESRSMRLGLSSAWPRSTGKSGRERCEAEGGSAS